jgi:hypothetical protein
LGDGIDTVLPLRLAGNFVPDGVRLGLLEPDGVGLGLLERDGGEIGPLGVEGPRA